MKISRTTNASLLLAGALVVGCGDDDGGNGTGVDINMDSGVSDPIDASTPDAARDGAIKPASDAGVVCSFRRSEIRLVSNTSVSPTDPIAVSVNNAGASLSWVEYRNGTRKLFNTWYGTDKTSELAGDWDAGASTQAEPGNVALGTGFLTVWSDDEGSAQTPVIDVRAQGWSANGLAVAPMLVKVSNDGATHLERTPVVARGADGNVLVVWQNATENFGSAQLLSDTGSPIGAPQRIENFNASSTQPVLAALNNRYVLAWVDGVKLRVHMALFSAAGLPIGGDVLVDVEANAAGTVDLATSAGGGAIVFDVRVAGTRREVRLHTFDANGALEGAERVVTNNGNTGSTPSIVPLAAGYIVAYRSLQAPDMQLQLVLVDNAGLLTGGISVTPILDDNAPLQLRIAPDGRQLFLSWLDRVGGSVNSNLQRTWISCD